ncbi:MAG: hypothetical protein JNL44_04350 [Gemmatimonadetes bacterium]|nr:hypothetical protein [Gemmatimonadota bacterium]
MPPLRHGLRRLHALRGTFGRDAARERSALLRALRRARWTASADLRAYHDELLYIAAFPDTGALHRAARRELARTGRRVRALSAAARARLDDSALAGSTTAHTFMYGVARWLAAKGERVGIDRHSPAHLERLDPFLRQSLTPAESDRFDSGEVGTAEWLADASRDCRQGAFGWLLGQRRETPEPERMLYDDAEVPLRWELAESPLSASRNRIALGQVVPRRSARVLPADVAAHLRRPLKGITRLRGDAARRWHDVALAALAARTREVFPTIYANHDEIYRCPLGEGTDLCVLGVTPGDRSALEANYGYVMFSNGIPVGYGGVTTLGAQANTGANLFESFRRSEAAFLFAQSLRAFRTLFGVTRFVVNPYQFGRGNEEAITSGAYWFYDRLGFRPTSRPLAALASRERSRIAADRTHRSSRRTLQRLAGGDLVLPVAADDGSLLPERMLLQVGAGVARELSGVPAGGREAFLARAAERQLRLCTGERRRLRPSEQLGARFLAPVIRLIEPTVRGWSREERQRLWRLVQLKGARQERGYARAAAGIPVFWETLRRIVNDP